MRGIIIALAAATVGIAGCFDAPTLSPPGTTPGGSLTALWGVPVNVADDTAEPGVVIGPDLTVWVHAPGVLYKAAPNTTAFEQVTFGCEERRCMFGGDADLVIGKDPKDMYYTDLEDLVGISVFSSHDGGESWFYHPLASDVPVVDRQWITAGPDAASGGAEAVYLTYNQLASGVWVTKSTDGGMTWTPHLAFATSQTTQEDFQTMGNIVVDSAGVIHVAWTMGSAGAPFTPAIGGYAVVVSTSKDGGLTWSHSKPYAGELSPANLFPILAVDVEDTLYLTYSKMGDDGSMNVWIQRSADQAATWTDAVAVNKDPGSHVQPWVSAGDLPGELVVAWYTANETKDPSEVEGDWYVQVAYTRDGNAENATWVESRAVGAPIHTGPICVYGIACSGGRELLDFFQARLDPLDRVHVAYADDETKGGRAVFYVRSDRGISAPVESSGAALATK